MNGLIHEPKRLPTGSGDLPAVSVSNDVFLGENIEAGRVGRHALYALKPFRAGPGEEGQIGVHVGNGRSATRVAR